VLFALCSLLIRQTVWRESCLGLPWACFGCALFWALVNLDGFWESDLDATPVETTSVEGESQSLSGNGWGAWIW